MNKRIFLASIALSSALAIAPSHAADDAHGAADVPQIPPTYKHFDPPETKVPKYFSVDKLVINFQGQGRAKFLALDLKFMSYYPVIVEVEMEHLRPILVDRISNILRQKTYSELSQPDGSEVMRADILKAARAVMKKFKIYPDLVEDVYLDRFVMQ